jgi:hypothetical protein
VTSPAFVTLGSFDDTIAAELARAKLESAGIAAHLGDEATVSIDWQLTNALGGIRLRVDAAEAEAARAILREPPAPTVSTEPAEALTPREQRVERAAKIALFGCMFGPLLLYAIWLIAGVLAEPGELRPMVRRQLQFAMTLTLFAFVGFTVVGVLLFGP